MIALIPNCYVLCTLAILKTSVIRSFFFKKWLLTHVFAGPPPTYTPSDYVFIVRTASGKYAKLKAKSFYDDEGNSGIYSFEYAIQPNGSTNLN